MRPEVSVIVPTRNRSDILRLSLPRLLGQDLSPQRYEVVIVDDASEDDTEKVVADYRRSNLVFLRLPTRRAAAYARNRAIEHAQGEILVFVDDDSLVEPDFLSAHLAIHRRHSRTVVTGPIIEVTEPQSQSASALGARQGFHTNPFPTLNASVARSLVLGAGGFDEEFGEYGWEDPELYHRIRQGGVQTRFTRAAPIFHYKPERVRTDFVRRIELEKSRGRMGALFYAKHPKFSVGLQTKQLSLFRAADVIVNAIFRLDERVEEVVQSRIAPDSGLWRIILLNHVEIDEGYREWKRLGPKTRDELATATILRNKGKPVGGDA
jgi:glycosyltransferase involved in cell wall biosynthesis